MIGVANAALCCSDHAGDPFEDPARDFTDSLSLAPDNIEALMNLDLFLAVLDDLRERGAVPPGIDPSRLDDRRGVVAKVVSTIPKECLVFGSATC